MCALFTLQIKASNVVVADSCNHQLQVLTEEGAFPSCCWLQTRGGHRLQFHYPRDIAVDHNGRLIVTELWNHRVQVLYPDLSFSHFSCYALNNPHGVAIDQEGMVCISDYGNHQIKKITH